MNPLLRSPNGGGMSPALGGSQPNLSTPTEFENHQVTFRNKRKAYNEDENIMQELSDIKKQMADMMSLIASSSKFQTESINKLCQEMSSIKSQVNTICTNMESMAIEQNKLKIDMAHLMDTNNALETKVVILEKNMNTLKSSNGQEPSVSYNALVTECQERTSRAKNIIIAGIQEPTSEIFTERLNHDSEEVQKVIKSIKENCPEPVQVTRLGKYQQDKLRPVKVCFKSEEVVKQILRNKNNTSVPNIKIYSDQTPYQREVLKKLKEELESRTSNGEQNLGIKYIKGEPKIIELLPKNSLTQTISRQPTEIP